ncbi:pectinesterase inhibitor 4-like [Neltuma alba]|uniref:pectinesterase inhibitor 4-like n=1 Tax=Neltuma alba TaxID=207710 RepID=UPI0010A54CE7|nr:pectinesterase inhibitor 4-like [Prosopis alba]
MEGNTFTILSFHLLLFFTLLSQQASACNNSTINNPSYYSQKSTNPSSNQTVSSSQKNTMNKNNYYKSFVFTSCNTSTYPSICYQSLYQYASKIKADPFILCNSSLALVLKESKKTYSVISKLLRKDSTSETAAKVLKDCLDNVRSSVDEIQESLDDMNNLEDSYDKEFQMSTIKTYVSSAITDHETCFDGLDEENVDASVRDKVRNSVLNVQRMTSNSLYFINNLKY